MRKTGVKEIWEQGRVITLAPLVGVMAHDHSSEQIRLDAGQPCAAKACPTASPTATQPLQVELFIGYPATTTQPVSFNSSVNLGFGVYFSAKYGSTWGPTYRTLKAPKECIGEALATIGSVATSIATWINGKGSSYGPNIVEWAEWFLAGEITAAEFVAVMFAILTSVQLLAILGALLLTASSIYLLYKCMHG